MNDPDHPWTEGAAPAPAQLGADPSVRMRAVFRLEEGRLATLYLDTGEWASARPTVSLWRLQAEIGPLLGRVPQASEVQAAARRAGVTLLRVIVPN